LNPFISSGCIGIEKQFWDVMLRQNAAVQISRLGSLCFVKSDLTD